MVHSRTNATVAVQKKNGKGCWGGAGVGVHKKKAVV